MILVQRLAGLDIPTTADEACRPGHVALLVYDMQQGILQHVRDRDRWFLVSKEVIAAARDRGVPVHHPAPGPASSRSRRSSVRMSAALESPTSCPTARATLRDSSRCGKWPACGRISRRLPGMAA